MNIHEYQAKALLRKAGVNVPTGIAATTVEEAVAAYKDLHIEVCAVKSQIHAGGRGKGKLFDPKTGALVMEGGVKVARNYQEVEKFARNILGNRLVTVQTGPKGKIVHRIYIEKGSMIARELYVGMVMDRTLGQPVMMVSTEGGMEIEQVAHNSPEKIHRAVVDPALGLQPHQAARFCYALGLKGAQFKAGAQFLTTLAKAFLDLDASLFEINPLVVTKTDEIIALDAKINFDDNAEFRHKEFEELRDLSEEEPAETEARKYSLNFIKLDGNIGCMVNGAGLAMATMDVIKLHGGEPANFLDVGGGATAEAVEQAFKLILADTSVKGVLINIFGGIMRCDIIAEGVIAAARNLKIHVPVVVRLKGANVEQGKELFAKSGLAITTADELSDAAKKIVAAAK
ncbi:MAG TPA: ADP-forming succinate--CoA ligase subunit beta [Planctomycetota bacterium]|nr:ADP-forming succinate--CoA ligase subunit beta [Planctomycetota bacterium]